ncbi:hypothetical protein H4696_009658 [Amycolatopsis lexingtonensis]|uniref:Uncharacterized protein n=1 Tax=Amycolatopsis lexingtonensis TaxID=218822 RepID=A0ABR9IH96_9PSEU|nr:hypothetical protein [Amycolatopsis lexingtonensis]
MVFDAQRRQAGADTQQKRGVIDDDRDDVQDELDSDGRVGMEVERPVQHEAEPERAAVRDRDRQPHGPAEQASENGQQPEVDAERQTVDEAEAEKRRGDDPRQTQREYPDDGPAEGAEAVSGRTGLLGGHPVSVPAGGDREPSGR